MSKLLFLVTYVVFFIGYSNAELKKSVKLRPEVAHDILQAIAMCVADVGITANALESVKEGRYTEDQSFKKFVYCSFDKAGYLENGKLNVDKAVAIFPNEPEIKATIEKCSEVEVGDKVDFPSKFIKCFSDVSPVQVVA